MLTGDGTFDPDDPQAPLLEIGIHPASGHSSFEREVEGIVSQRMRRAQFEWRKETEFWSRKSAEVTGTDLRGRPVVGELLLKKSNNRSAILLALVSADNATMLPTLRRTMDEFPW